MTDELKPCPFCGGEILEARQYKSPHFSVWWFVECRSCRAKGTECIRTDLRPSPKVEDDEARSRAIKAWNRRSPQSNNDTQKGSAS